MLVCIAVALFASFAPATQAKFPSADADAHVLASLKVALELGVTLVSRLGVYYLDNLRLLRCHHLLLHRLLLFERELERERDKLLQFDLVVLSLHWYQGWDWLNAADSQLGAASCGIITG